MRGIAAAPPDDYSARFDRMDARINEGRGYADSLNTSGQLAWGEGQILEAYAEMYRATGETAYLDHLIEHFDRVLADRDDARGVKDSFRKTSMAGWGSEEFSPGRWHVWAVHTAMLCLGPMDFVMAEKAEHRLHDRYGKKADEYLTRIKECVAAHDREWRDGPAPGEGHYVDPALEFEPLPLNQQNALGLVELDLYLVTRDHKYRNRAEALANYFRARLRRTSDGAYDWCYAPPLRGGAGTGSEDISHAGMNVEFAARCQAVHMVFEASDMTAFARTWTAHVRRARGEWADTVCGAGGTNNHVPQAFARWLDLAPYDASMVDDAKAAFAQMDEERVNAGNLLGLAKLAHRQRDAAERKRWHLPHLRLPHLRPHH